MPARCRKTPVVVALLLLALLLLAPVPAAAQFRGYVETPYGVGFCMQETHILTDPCTGRETLLDEFLALDLDPYLCRHVVLSGPDVGIECEVIGPQSIAIVEPACPIPFTGLWLSDAAPPQVNWGHVPCARSFDVVRGSLASLRPAPALIDLGPVACLADDVPQGDWWYTAGPADAEEPPPGAALFYLARAAGLPFGDMTYGHATDGRERVPMAGDCPP